MKADGVFAGEAAGGGVVPAGAVPGQAGVGIGVTLGLSRGRLVVRLDLVLTC